MAGGDAQWVPLPIVGRLARGSRWGLDNAEMGGDTYAAGAPAARSCPLSMDRDGACDERWFVV